MLKRIIVLCLAVLAVSSANASLVYQGSLSTENGGLSGTGIWVTDEMPTTFGWEVTHNGNLWHYKYVLSVPRKEISHLNIEVSSSFRCKDILNETGNFGDIDIGWINPSSGNPGMPSSIYGIKFDETWGINLTVEFDTSRNPVWGDFYAKNGFTTGTPNTIWNASFGTDPLNLPGDGSFNNKILVPNSIPEPATMGILTFGAAALFYRR